MDKTTEAEIAAAVEDTEAVLNELSPELSLQARKALVITLLRNGLIQTSKRGLDHESELLVEASRVLERGAARH